MLLQRSGWGFYEDFLKHPETPLEKLVGGSIWIMAMLAGFGVIPLLAWYFAGNWLDLGFGYGAIFARTMITIVIWIPSFLILALMSMGMGEEMPPEDPDEYRN